MTCPRCGNALTLGESRVRIREDGTLAHVKCDAAPVREPQQARPAPAAPAADEREVVVLRHYVDPFRYEVTDQSGEVIWAGPSGTLLGQWKRTRPDLRIVLADDDGPTTDPECGKLGSTKQKRQRRGQEH